MIDWFRGEIDFLHEPIPTGHVLSIDSDGSVEWDAVKSVRLRSSHETSICIRSSGGDGTGMATSLMIDGNLAKFLQGHNIFGSLNLNVLLAQTFEKIYQAYLSHFEKHSSFELTYRRILKGDYRVKMIDVNQLYDVGNDESVESWLHAAHMNARSRHGRSSRDKGTVYLGKSSRRWAMKFYNKHREINSRGKTHQIPDHLTGLGLEEFIKGKLRAELRIFSKELQKHDITHGYHLTPEKIKQLFNIYLGKIDMNTNATLIDEKLLKLPRTVQSTYQLWRQGADLRSLMTKPSFYRHRSILLESGVDINMPCQSPEHNNVIPLMRIIEAKPVEIPNWAYDKELIAAA